MKIWLVVYCDYEWTNIIAAFPTEELANWAAEDEEGCDVQSVDMFDDAQAWKWHRVEQEKRRAAEDERRRREDEERQARVAKDREIALARDELLGRTTGPGTWRGSWAGYTPSREQIEAEWNARHGA